MVKRTTVGVGTFAAALVVGLALLTPGAVGVRAAGVQAAQPAPTQMPMGQMHMSMQDMMKMHEQMLADFKAEQSKLDDLVKKMNAATGAAKVNAVADVVTQLVQDHKTMGDRMGTVHSHMMMNMGQAPAAK